ncbi:MAG TPA: UDP-N-acetylmuramoyl-tripeptide--D-alanyl-D-alanine ligase [Acidimicrobiales bacterium]|nr:UDP-N-acetylmuramoyl-tripeptide--D-alanyl-D-alanine ligase [Acidimicrobiales bacterium]
MTLAAVVACLVALTLSALRWLRVAQREHYLPGSVSTFALRWWWGLGFNRLLAIVILVDLLLAGISPFFALLGSVAVAVGPFGLKLRGCAPGPIAWTRRLRTLAGVWALLSVAVVAAGALVGRPAVTAYLAAVATPLLVDAALALTRPLEARLAQGWIDQAAERLRSVAPLVVAITGSYGKTSTKGYVAHLVQGTRSVVATPASFNNALGLARSINENLAPGTEVFVAEMGTYGPGEIAAMVSWARPTVAAITAIGPVHLERMKSEDGIVEAKREIFATASTVVLNVDDDRLSPLADGYEQAGKDVIRCSANDAAADVSAVVEGDDLVVRRAGAEIARFTRGDENPGNVAVAVALAGASGVPDEALAKRLPSLPGAPNRRSITTGSTGATFIDDTYNSNPTGARAALATLERLATQQNANRVVLVTPGMVELGPRQHEENARFAAAASEICTDIVVIGSTNRRALQSGAHEGRARVTLVDDRAGATSWVKENTAVGDVVLFENDLPDHFP